MHRPTADRQAARFERNVSKPADIILIGHGTGDALQLTVQAQSVLQRYGFAHAIGVPPLLTRFLSSAGVDLEHLDERMLAAGEAADALLVAADQILKQTEVERPVLVLVPGNPLFLNSLSRFLVAEAGSRDLSVQRLAGVSQLDVIVNELGIDVAARGLLLLEARHVALGRSQPNPEVPSILFRAGDLIEDDDDDGTNVAALQVALATVFPTDHPVTLFNIGLTGDGTSFATAPLADLAEFSAHLHAGSSMFIGPVRR